MKQITIKYIINDLLYDTAALVTRQLLRRQLLRPLFRPRYRVRVRVVIGFYLRFRVRIKERYSVKSRAEGAHSISTWD